MIIFQKQQYYSTVHYCIKNNITEYEYIVCITDMVSWYMIVLQKQLGKQYVQSNIPQTMDQCYTHLANDYFLLHYIHVAVTDGDADENMLKKAFREKKTVFFMDFIQNSHGRHHNRHHHHHHQGVRVKKRWIAPKLSILCLRLLAGWQP